MPFADILKKAKAPKPLRFQGFFGAGGVTRTHDLLITKCIQTLRLTVFRDFGAFPLGILREVRPILSTVFVRSFLKCSPSQGHFHLTHSGSIPAGYSPVVM